MILTLLAIAVLVPAIILLARYLYFKGMENKYYEKRAKVKERYSDLWEKTNNGNYKHPKDIDEYKKYDKLYNEYERKLNYHVNIFDADLGVCMGFWLSAVIGLIATIICAGIIIENHDPARIENKKARYQETREYIETMCVDIDKAINEADYVSADDIYYMAKEVNDAIISYNESCIENKYYANSLWLNWFTVDYNLETIDYKVITVERDGKPSITIEQTNTNETN